MQKEKLYEIFCGLYVSTQYNQGKIKETIVPERRKK
jgi:hypothetical protein